jgi:hypothetical protein
LSTLEILCNVSLLFVDVYIVRMGRSSNVPQR